MVILRVAWSLVCPLTAVVVCLQLTLQYASGLPAQSKGPLRLSGSYVWWLPVGCVIVNSADSSGCLPPAFSQRGFRQYSIVESQPSASCRGDTRATLLPLSNAADTWTARHCRMSHIGPLKDGIWSKSGVQLGLLSPFFGTTNSCGRVTHVTRLYRMYQEEWTKLRESVPYVKIYRYNPKHLYPKLNGYGDNGQRSLKLWQLLHTYWLPHSY